MFYLINKISFISIISLFLVSACSPKKNKQSLRIEELNIKLDSIRTMKKWKHIFINNIVDFKSVSKDQDKVDAIFYLKNNTNKEQFIENISYSCGCISVSYPQYAIRKGCKDSIIVSIDIKKEHSFFQKNLWIFFHSYTKRPVLLTIKGHKDNNY